MRIVVSATLATLLPGLVATGWAQDRFERVSVSLEQNIQDEDIEVKFEAVAPSVGLTALKVTAPDGRTVIDFATPASKSGIQHLTLESPEPKNDGSLQADFPEGAYRFSGTTANGANLRGEARLSHQLPKPVTLVWPKKDASNGAGTRLQVRWSPVQKAAGYVVVVEDERSGREMSTALPASVTAFTIPEGFLAPGTEYKLAIGTVARDGNRSFMETSFTTASRR